MNGLLMMLVVIAANALGAAMAVPQARKLLRTRSVEGVSLTWAAVSAGVNAWWGVYAVGVGDISILPVSIVSTIAYVAIAVTILRYDRRRPAADVATSVGVAAVVTIVPLFALHIGGWVTAGIVLGALYGVQLFPAVVTVYRVTDVSGVSVATWAIAFVEAALWGAYGLVGLDAGLLTLATTGIAMSALVLARLFARRPRARRATSMAGIAGLAPA